MSQALCDCQDVYTIDQHLAGCSVSEITKSHIMQAGLFKEFLEVPDHLPVLNQIEELVG